MEEKIENNEIENQDKNKKKKSPLKLIGEFFAWALIGLFVCYFVVNGIDRHTGYNVPFFGLRTSVVVSPSMQVANPENDYLDDSMKRIKKYDVITTLNYSSFDDIKLYDVLTYYSSNGLICHRVVAKYVDDNGQQFVVTRGDANNVNDAPVNYSMVRGKVILVTPAFGHFLLFVQSPYFILAFFGSAFFIFLGLYIIKSDKNKKLKNNEETTPESESVSSQDPEIDNSDKENAENSSNENQI